MLIFGAKNSNFFNLKLNAARFAHKVVKWDFLSDFQTLWHEVNSSLLLLLQHYLCDFLEVFSGSNFEGHQSSLSEVLKNHCLLHCPNLSVWKSKKTSVSSNKNTSTATRISKAFNGSGFRICHCFQNSFCPLCCFHTFIAEKCHPWVARKQCWRLIGGLQQADTIYAIKTRKADGSK